MSQIKLLIMDVDGTLTDGKIYMSNTGEMFKAFNIKDGYAIHDMLSKADITPIIITGRTSSIVENRCDELGIKELHQGIKNKIQKLDEILNEKNITYSQVAYIGDDINDLCCMKMVKENGGIIGCPRDSAKEVFEICDFVSEKKGGDGAVRDFIERIINGDS